MALSSRALRIALPLGMKVSVTFEKVTDTLTDHPWDPTYKEKKKKLHQQQQQQKDKNKNPPHQEEKTEVTGSVTSFAQTLGRTGVICNCCGKPGHISPQCKEKDTRPKDQWYKVKIAKTYQMLQRMDRLDPVHEADEGVSLLTTDDGATQSSTTDSRSRRSESDATTFFETVDGTDLVFEGFQCAPGCHL